MDSMTLVTRHTMIPTGLILIIAIEAETTTIQACIHPGMSSMKYLNCLVSYSIKLHVQCVYFSVNYKK